MIVINLNEGLSGVTCDLTTITVDSTEITVDNNNTTLGYTIKFIPRYFTENVILNFRNELTNEETVIETSMTQINGLCYVIFSFPIEDATSFELTVLNASNEELLFRGKVFATLQTDLENYKMTKPNENNKIIM
jgi:hypothetical protein